MSPVAISGIVFGVVFGGALLGMVLRARLPEHHLSQDSRDVVKLGMGLIGTIAALVLGLLIASAKSSFDSQKNLLSQMAANIGLMDRILAHYGPEAKEARVELRAAVARLLDQTWPEGSSHTGQMATPGGYENLYEMIQALTPKGEAQVSLKAAALKTMTDIAQERWQLFAQKGSSIPVPFLVVLMFWLAMIFASFSMFVRPNATVVVTLFVCALSVSGAIFLILELDRPFEGFMKISSDPLKGALQLLGG
jgi:hypothetical protein